MQSPQPTTEQFQNNLFEEILQLDLAKRIWVEDESISIGRVFLPNDLWTKMSMSPLIEVDLEKSLRVNRLVNEYGKADQHQFLDAMERITTKLGGQHYKAAKEKLLQGDMASAIEILLVYYDKTYQAGLDKKKGRIKATVAWTGKNINAFVEDLMKVN